MSTATAPTAHSPLWQRAFGMEVLPTDLRRYIVLLFLAGVAVMVSCTGLVIVDDDNVGLRFLVIVLLFLATGLVPPIEMMRGTQAISYRFNEFPALIGLAIGPAYLIPLAAVLGDVPSWSKDYFQEPAHRFKIVFNVGLTATTTAITAAVGSLGTPPISYILAACLSCVFGDLAIARAIEMAGGTKFSDAMKKGWGTRLGIPAATAVICLLLDMLPGDRIAIAAVPLVIVCVWAVCGAWFTLVRDREQWRTMDDKIAPRLIESSVNGQPNEDEMLTAALTGALEMFQVTRAEVILPESGFTWTLAYGLNESIQAVPHSDLHPVHVTQTPTVVVVDLRAGGQTVGSLVLYFRRPDRRPQDRTRLVNTFAAQIAANLLVARTYQHMKANAEQKAHEALHDSLTGLGNRQMLYSDAPHMLADTSAAGYTAALLLFDLDGFKKINDTLGHHAGDDLLREVGARMRRSVRRNDLAIRLGGDEFAILLTDLANPIDAERVAANLIAYLAEPIEVEGIKLTVDSSVGIAIHNVDATDIDSLLRLSDVAMYEAKNGGRGRWCRYSASGDTNSPEALTMSTDLRRAIIGNGDANRQNELVLHYQPQIEPATNRVTGMEALVRWEHPTLGFLLPNQFVPLAEHSGLIRRFTLAILDQAIKDHARLRQCNLNVDSPMTMSVNLSARNLLDAGLPEDIGAILARYGVPPQELVVEITETVAPSDSSAVDRVLSKLNALGCQISLDDFGTGYSSLSSLTRATYREIKIDRGFVKNILTRSTSKVTVQAIIDIAHGHGCRVVAEGVEDEATVTALQDMDCDIVQGFYIARPQPLWDVERWLKQWNRTHKVRAVSVAVGGSGNVVALSGRRPA